MTCEGMHIQQQWRFGVEISCPVELMPLKCWLLSGRGHLYWERDLSEVSFSVCALTRGTTSSTWTWLSTRSSTRLSPTCSNRITWRVHATSLCAYLPMFHLVPRVLFSRTHDNDNAKDLSQKPRLRAERCSNYKTRAQTHRRVDEYFVDLFAVNSIHGLTACFDLRLCPSLLLCRFFRTCK